MSLDHPSTSASLAISALKIRQSPALFLDFGLDLEGGFLPAGIIESDVAPGLGKQNRGRAADAAGTAGDEGRPAF